LVQAVGSFKLAEGQARTGTSVGPALRDATPRAITGGGTKVGVTEGNPRGTGGTAPKAAAKLPPPQFAGDDEEWNEF
jgi:hypothetical protein